MIKESDIPPIRGNPRLGKETARDASVKFGGAQLPKESKPSRAARSPARSMPKQSKRRTRQQTFAITNKEQLRELVKLLGINATAVVNLALSELAQAKLKK